MLVLDASAAIEWLLGHDGADQVHAHLIEEGQTVHVPHLWIVEVTQVLRRFERAGSLPPARAAQALAAARDLPAVQHDHRPLMGRVWQLRNNLTAYDAVYVSLAEALDAPLVTTDSRLGAAPGHRADVVLVGST